MIRDEIKKELVEAMKCQNKDKVATLRLVNAAIKDKDIADRSKGNFNGIDEGAVLSLLQTMIKQRKESIAMYQQGNRSDLVAHEQSEIDVIQSFLPKQMTQEEMIQEIQNVITASGATSIKDMGKVMGLLRAKYAGQMDFGVASGIIKQELSK